MRSFGALTSLCIISAALPQMPDDYEFALPSDQDDLDPAECCDQEPDGDE